MRPRFKTLIGSAAAAAFALLGGFVVFAASIGHYVPRLPPQPAAQTVDAIVVLTGGTDRVREGLRLFEQVNVKRVLISGVHRQTSRDDLMLRSGIAKPLFACCVDIGHDALNTSGNAIETRDWAEAWGFKRLLVVTSNYHMPRSLAELRRALPDVDLVPHAVVSRSYQAERWWLYPSAIRLAAIEYVKYLDALSRHGLERLVLAADTRATIRASVSNAEHPGARLKP